MIEFYVTAVRFGLLDMDRVPVVYRNVVEARLAELEHQEEKDVEE